MNETYAYELGETVIEAATGERVVFKGQNWDGTRYVIGRAGSTESETVDAETIVSADEYTMNAETVKTTKYAKVHTRTAIVSGRIAEESDHGIKIMVQGKERYISKLMVTSITRWEK